MKTKRITLISLIAILCLSGFLYFYKLGTIPSGFYVDEASVAYNAYSILKTGKDEYGFSFPVYFRLLGSYTPSLFIYLSSAAIKFFGNAPKVFRSISALSAIISVFFFYLLVIKMKLYKLKASTFITVFFFAISPWMVFNARLGYETTLAFLVFNIGTYLLFLSYKKIDYLILAVAFLSLSTYISHNQRFLAPLLLAGYFLVIRHNLFQKVNYKKILKAFLVGILLNLPNLYLIGTNAFWIKSVQFKPNYFWNLIIYLSPVTLFYGNPDIDMQHTVPELSMLFNWMVIPYFIGLYLLIKNIKDYKYKYIALYFFVSLLPAAFSSFFISEQRAFPFIVPLFLVLGLGIEAIVAKLKPKLKVTLFAVVAGYSLLVLGSSYFVLFPKERAQAWNYGYDKIAEYIQQRPQEDFLFDDARNPRAYILLLYYLNYSPEDYQSQVDPYYRNNYYSASPPATYYQFSNVEVRQINWGEDPGKDLMIIGDPLSISEIEAKEHNLTKVAEFKGLSADTIFKIYKTNPQIP